MTTITLYYNDDRSDKVYVLSMQGTTVKAQFGRRGCKFQKETWAANSKGEATKFFERKATSKLRKGYQVVTGAKAKKLAAAA